MENAKLKLTKYDREKFEDFCLYLNSSNLDQEGVKEIKYEILDHLIEGQKAGKGFDELFGNNPQEYTKNLVRYLPKKSWKDQWKFLIMVYFIALIIRVAGLFNEMTLNEIVIDIIIFPIIVILFITLFMKLNKWTAFEKSTGMIIVSVLVIQILSIFYSYIKSILM
ncbi:DUF1129 family protein [Bacillus sp. V3B]|uniref:DUF1129 family protein n=1 Tax=Bacillus sp. V3B TaxID=2804915 RepID=UPI002108B3D2|nr:DUF1129 family protein [Bacillus sp. V3B]MCQ6277293.1 DUF1129 family protein [Bacillus sp. V3B]